MSKGNGLDSIINNFIHDNIIPLSQSLKAHIELSHNHSYHISPKVLKDIEKRLLKLKLDLLELESKKEDLNERTPETK